MAAITHNDIIDKLTKKPTDQELRDKIEEQRKKANPITLSDPLLAQKDTDMSYVFPNELNKISEREEIKKPREPFPGMITLKDLHERKNQKKEEPKKVKNKKGK